MSIRVEGIPGLDGEYPLDLNSLSNRDFRTVKQMAGVRALEMEDALAAGDNDVMVAFGAIALRRAGRVFREDQLWDAPLGSITYLEDKAEGEEEAPEEEDPTPSEPQPSAEPSGASSGPSSSPTGGATPPTSTPNGTGTPESATGAISGLETSPASPPSSS